MRAKDSDRNDTCQVLDNALSEGQLSSEEHRQRVAAATNAATLGELGALVGDLQNSNAPVRMPNLKPSRTPPSPRAGGGLAIKAAGLVVAVLLGVGIGWGVYGDTPSPLSVTSDPGARPDGVAPVVLTPPRQLQSLGGLTGLIEQTRKRFGDAKGFRLVVYPDYAILDRADPNDGRRQLSYSYRGGWGDPSGSTKTGGATAVDLSAFDAKAVVGVLRGAPETLGIKPADVKSTYLVVAPTQDPTTPGATTLTVYVSTDYGSGYIELAGDGTVKQVSYPS
jgi:hypothetical protein